MSRAFTIFPSRLEIQRRVLAKGRNGMSVELQIVMPVHNEAGVIGTTLREWHETLSPWVNVQFILT